jgi:hypothetical protein
LKIFAEEIAMSMTNTVTRSGDMLAPASYWGQSRSRISWGAVLAGAVVAVATTLLLSLLGAAMGARRRELVPRPLRFVPYLGAILGLVFPLMRRRDIQ